MAPLSEPCISGILSGRAYPYGYLPMFQHPRLPHPPMVYARSVPRPFWGCRTGASPGMVPASVSVPVAGTASVPADVATNSAGEAEAALPPPKPRRRTLYLCNACGQPKKGHFCTVKYVTPA